MAKQSLELKQTEAELHIAQAALIETRRREEDLLSLVRRLHSIHEKTEVEITAIREESEDLRRSVYIESEEKIREIQEDHKQALVAQEILWERRVADLSSRHADELSELMEEMQHTAAFSRESFDTDRQQRRLEVEYEHALRQINELQEERESLQMRLSELQKDLTEKDRIEQQLQSELQKLRSQADAGLRLRQDSDRIGTQNDSLSETLVETFSQLNSSSERCVQLQRELDSARESSIRSSMRVHDLESNLTATRSTLQDKEQQIADLQQDLNESRDLHFVLHKKIEFTSSSLSEVRESVRERDEQILKQKNEISQLEENLDRYQRELSAQHLHSECEADEVRRLTTQLQQLRDQQSSTSLDMESMMSKFEDAEKEIFSLKQRLELEQGRFDETIRSSRHVNSDQQASRTELYRVCLLLLSSLTHWDSQLGRCLEDSIDSSTTRSEQIGNSFQELSSSVVLDRSYWGGTCRTYCPRLLLS